MSVDTLKSHLFEAYDGFADKRIKRLSKSDLFIVDDRGDGDLDARKRLFYWFCMIFARVVASERIHVELRGNVPMSPSIEAWIHASEDVRMDESGLTLSVALGDNAKIEELADLVAAVVEQPYSVRSYKYVCPRVASSLRKLARILREYSDPYSRPSDEDGFSLFT